MDILAKTRLKDKLQSAALLYTLFQFITLHFFRARDYLVSQALKF